MSLFDFGDIVGCFSEPLLLIRQQEPVNDRGYFRRLKKDDGYSIYGSIQPMSDPEMQRLPEGQRVDELKKLYTSELLFTADTPGIEPDIIEHNGTRYQVASKHDWGNLGNYSRYTLRRIGQ